VEASDDVTACAEQAAARAITSRKDNAASRRRRGPGAPQARTETARAIRRSHVRERASRRRQAAAESTVALMVVSIQYVS
jgi:hypothetical protein